jgi:hypothetical protein
MVLDTPKSVPNPFCSAHIVERSTRGYPQGPASQGHASQGTSQEPMLAPPSPKGSQSQKPVGTSQLAQTPSANMSFHDEDLRLVDESPKAAVAGHRCCSM